MRGRRRGSPASGSAGAALKRSSTKSGAWGRFTDFELPPLTFAEFLRFRGEEPAMIEECSAAEGF